MLANVKHTQTVLAKRHAPFIAPNPGFQSILKKTLTRVQSLQHAHTHTRTHRYILRDSWYSLLTLCLKSSIKVGSPLGDHMSFGRSASILRLPVIS